MERKIDISSGDRYNKSNMLHVDFRPRHIPRNMTSVTGAEYESSCTMRTER